MTQQETVMTYYSDNYEAHNSGMTDYYDMVDRQMDEYETRNPSEFAQTMMQSINIDKMWGAEMWEAYIRATDRGII